MKLWLDDAVDKAGLLAVVAVEIGPNVSTIAFKRVALVAGACDGIWFYETPSVAIQAFSNVDNTFL